MTDTELRFQCLKLALENIEQPDDCCHSNCFFIYNAQKFYEFVSGEDITESEAVKEHSILDALAKADKLLKKFNEIHNSDKKEKK